MIKLKRQFKRRFKHLGWLHIAAILALIIILAGVTYAIVKTDGTEPRPTPAAADTKSAGPPVNLNPATPQEKQATENAKKNSITPQTPSETTASGKKKVYPVITSVSSNEVNAYVSGVVEDGGTCKATATSGSQTITASSSGFANVSTTSCAPIKLSLPSNGWSVVVSYTSGSYEGTSQPYAY
jgi:hypothetical protein